MGKLWYFFFKFFIFEGKIADNWEVSLVAEVYRRCRDSVADLVKFLEL